MLRHYLTDDSSIETEPNIDYKKLATQTTNYSGSDIFQVCKEAAMITLRKIFHILESGEKTSNLSNVALEKITQSTLEKSISLTRPATIKTLEYKNWQEKF